MNDSATTDRTSSPVVPSSSAQQNQPTSPSRPQSMPKPSTSPLPSFIAGFAGGSASTISLYPLDLIKVRMQVDERRRGSIPKSNAAGEATAASTTATTPKATTGAADKPRTICTTVRGVIRHEGYLGLYRGLAPAIIGSAASWGGFFILYEEMKKQMLIRKQASIMMSSNHYSSMPSSNPREGYDLTKDMHADEEIDVNTNNATIIKTNASKNTIRQNNTQSASSETMEQQQQQQQQQQQAKLGPIDHFSASCTAGACMVALTNPLWLIKTRLQLQNSRLQQQILSQPPKAGAKATATAKPAYRGLVHAARTIVREEGVLALYKGSVPAMMLVSHGGIQFVTYEFLKGHFANFTKNSKNNVVGGGGGGGGGGDDNQWKKSSGRSKGTVSERLRDSLGYLVMGAVSKFVASTTTYPLQVIKARLQQRSQVVEVSEITGEIIVTKREYTGVADCVGKILKNEGINGFFKGCVTNAMRVAPSAAITFVTYESVLDMLTE